MGLAIATWNINSVRLRVRQVTRFLRACEPDVLCLQEIKCRTDQFPHKPFHRLGYRYRAVNGQKGYHGVAVVSRRPLADISVRGFCGRDDARHLAVTVMAADDRPIKLHNFYVPAGGDEPDPAVNDKFAHKLAFLDEMRAWLNDEPSRGASIVVGDLNVAPLASDVWSHRQLLRIVSHTPGETERLERLRREGGWTDATRRFAPPPLPVFTWWSYRALDWRASNRGRRLDHIWVSDALKASLAASEVITAPRGWTRPSDHVPVIARLA